MVGNVVQAVLCIGKVSRFIWEPKPSSSVDCHIGAVLYYLTILCYLTAEISYRVCCPGKVIVLRAIFQAQIHK